MPWYKSLKLYHLVFECADPLVKNELQCPVIRTRMRRHVSDQFPVCGKPLPLISDKSLVHREFDVCHDKVFLHHMISQRMHEKGLTASVFPLDKTKRCPSLLDDGYVLQQRLNLTLSAYCNILKPCSRNDSAL